MTSAIIRNKKNNLKVFVRFPTTKETWKMMLDNLNIDEDDFCFLDVEIGELDTDINGLKNYYPYDVEDLDTFTEKYYQSDNRTKDCISAILEDDYSGDLECIFQAADDCEYFPDCYDMEQVAEFIAEKYNMLDHVPSWVEGAFDYHTFGDMLEINCNTSFIEEEHGMVMVNW